MREARYNQRAAGATAGSTGAKTVARPAKARASKAAAPTAAPDGLCGHRSMNGRTCTREQGHTAKNHRYS
jgi:hypothetical protein